MRSRNIKPGFFKNDALADCQPLARLLFAGLWCIADINGLVEDRPLRIKAELLPFDDVDINALLAELAARGFIDRFEAEGQRCIWIPKFRTHQNPHHRETASGLPLSPRDPSPRDTDAEGNRGNQESGIRNQESAGRARTKARPGPRQAQGKPKTSPGLAQDKPQASPRLDELFEAIADITGSDPKVSGSHIGKVCAALRKAEPPYTPQEVRQLPAAIPKAIPVLAGQSVTLGMIEKHIGLVRTKPVELSAEQWKEERAELWRQQSERTQRELAERDRNIKETREWLAKKRASNAAGTNATAGPEGGESPVGGNAAV